MGHKQHLKTIREAGGRIDRMIQRGQFHEASQLLQDLVLASMKLSQDLYGMGVRVRAERTLAASLPAKPPESQESVPATPQRAPRSRKKRPLKKRDQNVIAEMTRNGATMRSIAAVIGRTPSIVWTWQKKLGVQKGSR